MASSANAESVGDNDSKTGLLDLEKELTCSICTDILFQPLTLLDCLHTFCGSCLKEWFKLQASPHKAQNPFTCPSCRAKVRGTRHNASVNTLLDMFLTANPGKGRSKADKAELLKIYKDGDDVMPAWKSFRDPVVVANEQRMLAEAQAQVRTEREYRQLQQAASAQSGSLATSAEAVARPQEPSQSSRDSHRRHERSRQGRRSSGLAPEQISSRRERTHSPREPSQRQIEHQSSLRSIMSSDVDSSEMEAEIMRQILEEGLLDGIDLSSLDNGQEDQLSERIADAYRRRQRELMMASTVAGNSDATLSQARSGRAQTRTGNTARSQSIPVSTAPISASRPRAASRPRERLAVTGGNHERRRRTSSNTRRETSPTPAPISRQEVPVAATRSATDLSNRPRSNHSSNHRPTEGVSQASRRTTDPENRSSMESRSRFSPVTDPAITASGHAKSTSTSRATLSADQGSRLTSPPSPRLDPHSHGGHSRASSSTSATSTRVRASLYPEPSISCEQCGKQHIEYDLHYNCAACSNGEYNICLDCYRQGKGCLHWYGFGDASWPRYMRMAPPGGYPPNHPLPHTLDGHRYRKPKQAVIQPASSDSNRRPLTTEDPTARLQSGVFCAICQDFANACFWKCDTCNEGEWGFCNRCVNQGRHCTHPLLPLTRLSPQEQDLLSVHPAERPTQPAGQEASLALPQGASLHRGPGIPDHGPLKPLTFTTSCRVCHLPVQPSSTRFHCQTCSEGDYDICMFCYLKAVQAGRISRENGDKGWRRCFKGHRMSIVGFEDGEGGRKRVVMRERVGGWALKDESGDADGADDSTIDHWAWKEGPEGNRVSRQIAKNSFTRSSPFSPTGTTEGSSSAEPSVSAAGSMTTQFPPDGGVGMRAVALWSYFPSEGAADELMFPRGAGVTEVEDINGDWYWGVYAGGKGLFPGGYVQARI